MTRGSKQYLPLGRFSFFYTDAPPVVAVSAGNRTAYRVRLLLQTR